MLSCLALDSKRLWIYAGLGLAAGVGLVVASSSSTTPNGALPPTSPRPSLVPGSRVLLLGDSLAQGLAAPLRQLAVEAGLVFQADGRVGTRIADWSSQPWLAQALAFKPTITLISLGTNDMKMTNPLSEQPALVRIVQSLIAARSAIVWITPPTMPFSDPGVRTMLANAGVPLFRSESLPIPRGPDKIHPTALGYAGFAGALWSWLRPQALNGGPGSSGGTFRRRRVRRI